MPRPILALLAALALCAACLTVLMTGPGLSAAEDQGEVTEQDSTREAADEGGGGDRGSGDRSEVVSPEVTIETEGAEGLTSDLPELYLTGTVLDEKYEPIAEAWVLTDVETEPVQTDENGEFEILLQDEFNVDRGRSVAAWKPGLSIARKYTRQLEGTLLILKPDEGREVRVVDGDSSLPLEGVTLRILVEAEADREQGFFDLRNYAELPFEPIVTDADGKATIPDANISENYTLEVVAEGYPRRLIERWSLRRMTEIQMRKPEELRMRFVRKDGTPHANARLCFPWYRRIVELDEDGWGNLPPEANWGFWSVQLRDESTQWVWSQVDQGLIQSGSEIATDWRLRSGKLHVQGDEKADVFEVGTTAAVEGWGWNDYMPSPYWNDRAIEWYPVDEDGNFTIEQGWQGDITTLHVRRAGSKGVLLSEKLIGDGPYELTISAAAQVVLKVECERPETMEGASIKLYGHETDLEQTVSLASAQAELRLPVDEYTCQLVLAGSSQELPLGELYVAGLDMEHTFYFEGTRTVTGRITAGTKPLFPCRLDISSDKGFWSRVELRPDGTFELKGVPKEELRLRLRLEEQWLSPVEGSYLWITPGQQHFEYDFEVATLLLDVANLPRDAVDQISISRRAREGVSRYSPINGKRQRFSSASPKMPDLTSGPVELMVTPGRVQFNSTRTGFALSEQEIELAAGDVRSFAIHSPPTTLTRLLLDGYGSSVWGNCTWTPVDVPMLEDYPDFTPQEARSSNRPGQIGRAVHLLPGVWRMNLRAPFWAHDVRGNVGQGRVETEVSIDGSEKTFRIGMDRDGTIQLLRDEP